MAKMASGHSPVANVAKAVLVENAVTKCHRAKCRDTVLVLQYSSERSAAVVRSSL